MEVEKANYSLSVMCRVLGVSRSGFYAWRKRPRVSNDNPYSESLFRTLKYRPEFPSKPFASMESAKEWVAQFVEWYNHSHLHSGIQFVSPATHHAERHREVLRKCGLVLEAARTRNPNRWSGPIRNLDPIETVSLNPDPAVAQEQPAAKFKSISCNYLDIHRWRL